MREELHREGILAAGARSGGSEIVGVKFSGSDSRTDSVSDECLVVTTESRGRKGVKKGRSMQELKHTSGGGSVASDVPGSTPVGGVATKTKTAATSSSSSKPPPSRIQYFLNSGTKKHVFVGLLLVSAVACAPWFLLTSGSKHQNHADYMDQAEKARQSRLSSSAAAQSEAK